jgi:hypothetical protein
MAIAALLSASGAVEKSAWGMEGTFSENCIIRANLWQ